MATSVTPAAPAQGTFPCSVLSQSTDSQHRSKEYPSVHLTGTKWIHDMHQHKGPEASSGPGSGQQQQLNED